MGRMTFGVKVSKTVCLIHGWGLGPRIWDDFICRMPEDWRSITLAMPGYGARESNADVYSDNNVIADHLIDKIPDNAILVAWSLGGLIAIRLAQHLGDRLEMLILLASTPCFTKKKDWSFGVTEEKINKVARQLTESREKALQQFIQETAVGDDSPRTTIRLLPSTPKPCASSTPSQASAALHTSTSSGNNAISPSMLNTPSVNTSLRLLVDCLNNVANACGSACVNRFNSARDSLAASIKEA